MTGTGIIGSMIWPIHVNQSIDSDCVDAVVDAVVIDARSVSIHPPVTFTKKILRDTCVVTDARSVGHRVPVPVVGPVPGTVALFQKSVPAIFPFSTGTTRGSDGSLSSATGWPRRNLSLRFEWGLVGLKERFKIKISSIKSRAPLLGKKEL
jgi:hypothetical protein